jgi:hypothetical protein
VLPKQFCFSCFAPVRIVRTKKSPTLFESGQTKTPCRIGKGGDSGIPSHASTPFLSKVAKIMVEAGDLAWLVIGD